MKQLLRKMVKMGRENDLTWRYGFNLKNSVGYKLNYEMNLDETSENLLSNLNKDGVAITSVNDLLGNLDSFNELERSTEKLIEDSKERIKDLKSIADDTQAIGNKTFNAELLGTSLEFDADSIFAKFALQKKILNIANAYFGMFTKLRYYNVWYTLATQSTARESQLWHFDREDRYILKLFLYLNDVDEGAGPFTYAPETHRKGKIWGKKPEFFLEGNVERSNDEQMAQVIPQDKWITGIGKKGTIVFADTRGYHKGGEARTKDRLMYTCMFTSQASESKRLLKFPENSYPKKFTKEQLIAVKPF